ncbi:MAG TPA: hypothetical protein PKE51_12945, partial [Gemmatimonadaceae bacterium]|nr:hypothetical protein [Gemmatimonadaceae bacterium]
MNVPAPGILELARVLTHVSQRAHSAAGAAAVRALQPQTARAWLEAEHRRVGAMRTLITGDGAYTPEPIPDLSGPLARLRIAGASWSAEELRHGGVFLRSSRRTRDALREPLRPAIARAVLAPFADALL